MRDVAHMASCPHGDPNECECSRVVALWWLAAWRAVFVARFYDARPRASTFERDSRRRYAVHRHEKAARARAREHWPR